MEWLTHHQRAAFAARRPFRSPMTTARKRQARRGLMTQNPTKTELLAKLEADPRFKKSTKPGEAFIIVGAKPSVAQKPQATDAAPHGEGDGRS
jgi:hypothetical protein